MQIKKIVIFLVFSLLFLCDVCFSEINPGEIESHEADETIIYNWFSYVPNNINKENTTFILVNGEGGDTDYDLTTDCAQSQAEYRQSWADSLQIILLCAAIPRFDSTSEGYIYTVAFDKKCFDSTTDPFYQRPDIKVNLMIDKLKSELREAGYNISDKIFLDGHSNQGMFAQRYCLLHPERVQAVVAGQCGGFLTFPESSYNGTELNWAIGINDFQELTGYDFNQSVYRNVPQFIYIGDQDTEHSHFAWPAPENFWTSEEIDFINSIFGDSDPIRLQNQCNYMQGLGYNIEFKLYAGIGHETSTAIENDILAFFTKYK